MKIIKTMTPKEKSNLLFELLNDSAGLKGREPLNIREIKMVGVSWIEELLSVINNRKELSKHFLDVKTEFLLKTNSYIN